MGRNSGAFRKTRRGGKRRGQWWIGVRRMRWGRGRDQGGSFNVSPRQEGPPSPVTKDPRWRTDVACGITFCPRGLQAFQGPRRPENLAGSQRPCLEGGGTKLNRKLWRWVNMGLTRKYGGASRMRYLTLTTVGRARNQPSCF